jgi:DNA gyrase subunit B
MLLVCNIVSKNVAYDAQVKSKVTKIDTSFLVQKLSEQLELWLDQNELDGRTIIESALVARKAAEAAKKARAAVKNKAAEKKEKAFKMPTKLTDCWTKDRSKCELFLAEGLSAASGLVEARSSEFQAIYGLRGKCLSVLKTTPEKILANQEINNLIQALGLDCDTKTAKLTYDKDKLRYGKIIASADADFDGYAIENLIFNILWYLCPELIINGHVYSAVPPLFRVTTKKNEYIYLRDANALEDYKKEHANEIAVIGRMKGLGEQDSDELSYALLDPETRHIVQLKVTDFEKTDALFEDLYGKKVEPRVKFLLEHGEEANVD